MKYQFSIFYFQILLTIFFFCSCSSKSGKEEKEPVVKIQITVTQPQNCSFANNLELNAVTKFQKKSVVRANASGYIAYLQNKTGDVITSGSIFAKIKTKEQVALKSVDTNSTSYKKFQTPTNVTTGASGAVSSVNYLQGDFVNEGDILGEIVEPTSLVLLLNVPYEYHSSVNVGTKCEIVLPDGRHIFSTINQNLPTVDADSQTQTFLIHLSPEYQLPEGMKLIVRIPLKQDVNVLGVVRKAVQTDETQENFWVMKLINDSMAIKIPVVIGLQNDSLIEIISSKISKDDRIVLNGAFQMPDSSIVTIKN